MRRQYRRRFTRDEVFRGQAVTMEIRILQGGAVQAISPQFRLQVPNSDEAVLNAELSEPLDETPGRPSTGRPARS